MAEKALFRAEHIYKNFGVVQALKDFEIEIFPGEIRGLIGENGSGKSTFSAIASGTLKANEGELFLEDAPYNPHGTVDAMDKGISMVVQEQGTITGISVAANVFFGKEELFAKNGFMDIRRMNEETTKALEAIGVTGIAPQTLIDTLSFEDRKLIELARSMYAKPKLWIIDETTTALSISGREILYSLMERQKSEGGSVLFISHDIDEIMDKCDSLTILRDGTLTANLKKDEFDPDRIRSLMIGRELSGNYYRSDSGEKGISDEVVLEARNVSAGLLKNVSVQLHRGEILGIGGLSDCGMHELGKVMFGSIKPESGQVLKDGKEVVKDTRWAVKNRIAYLSKNRDQESLMPICSIKDNITLPSLKDLTPFGPISLRKQKDLAKTWSEKMDVKAPSIDVFCTTLSGGNKQKVVLAKWLGKKSNILILDCPTRGIDVGTKANIYRLIEDLKEQGISMILISEELPELIGMSDRIILLKDGEVTGTFLRSEGITEEKLIHKMI